MGTVATVGAARTTSGSKDAKRDEEEAGRQRSEGRVEEKEEAHSILPASRVSHTSLTRQILLHFLPFSQIKDGRIFPRVPLFICLGVLFYF